jgi:hypothetical protein
LNSFGGADFSEACSVVNPAGHRLKPMLRAEA